MPLPPPDRSPTYLCILFRFFTLFCVRFWGKGSIKTRKNPVSMPIYKISPKRRKAQIITLTPKARGSNPPGRTTQKHPAPSKRCRVFFLLKPYRTGQDSSCALTRVGHTSTKQHQRIPKSKRHPAKHAPERFVLGDHADPDRLMPAPRETDSQRRRPCRWQDAQVCAVDGVVTRLLRAFWSSM